MKRLSLCQTSQPRLSGNGRRAACCRATASLCGGYTDVGRCHDSEHIFVSGGTEFLDAGARCTTSSGQAPSCAERSLSSHLPRMVECLEGRVSDEQWQRPRPHAGRVPLPATGARAGNSLLRPTAARRVAARHGKPGSWNHSRSRFRALFSRYWSVAASAVLLAAGGPH